MEPEGSVPHSQQPATRPFSEPDLSRTCPLPPNPIPEYQFYVVLSSHLWEQLKIRE
jgi:hypothetical protein